MDAGKTFNEQPKQKSSTIQFFGGKMKSTRLIIALLVLLSLIPQAFTTPSAVIPAQPASVQAHTPVRLVLLTIVNNTGTGLWVRMDGTSKLGQYKHYGWSVYTGKTVLKIEQGTYIGSFSACGGREVSKKLIMTGSRKVTLKCGSNSDPENSLTLK